MSTIIINKPFEKTGLCSSWQILCIDIQKAVCSFEFKINLLRHNIFFHPAELEATKKLDDIALDIQNFVGETRDFLTPIFVNTANPTPDLTGVSPDRRQDIIDSLQIHRVQTLENDKIILKKLDSALEENINYFKDQKKQGVNGYIVTGFYTGVCVLKNVLDLREEGFEVIVPIDLIGDKSEFREIEALQMMHEAGALLTTSRDLLAIKHVFSLTQQAIPNIIDNSL